ncbi:DNA damage-inducible protein D [Candidatus Wolfebacteria bacterium RIFOXYB2_FULL_49_7]|uniref:DNA damage-inducible protein D n=1 Tax=Candidatus Wolfebacteria bacterium RIFOXYB1_FULL_54_12 TaxID=1802559 RepID=A0A1F8DX56_9BACT|nr:MAG: DNA damage-inducible protein D [Candidatus Wolfebacteria bacterium RIFOXYB1_FULL_54_12]OGM94068.1 MAG: DNA damage-inducible protein D [Candidatus Wolfebacteria bacterium RIFOXYB2_FULL_49_7]
MEKEIVTKLHKNFEEVAHEKEGVDFWYARELQELLGYEEWRNFEKVIEKAKIACENAGQLVNNHFVDVNKTIPMPKGAKKEIDDVMLTRYACYLIAQNGDPRKDEIAFAMTYFAVQTRKQEIVEQRLQDLDRLHAREKLTLSEKELSGVIFERGVDGKGFAQIRSKGDAALFGGYTTNEMKGKLGIPASRPLADFLPGVTIKAKDLANEITNFNIKKDRAIQGEHSITREHAKNNKDVRELLAKSGIRPESLPAEEDIKKVGRRVASEGKKLSKTAKKMKK